MSIYYAGIGSRKTPKEVLSTMSDVAANLEDAGLILRSGGAAGADAAFFAGLENESNSQIFIPWQGFQGFSGTDEAVYCLDKMHPGHQAKAMELAEQHHPAWQKLTPGAKRLMSRNCMQVMGPDLETPSSFVLCWTPGGSGSGGTGQAIRLAKQNGIPVFDMGSDRPAAEMEQEIIEIIERNQS